MAVVVRLAYRCSFHSNVIGATAGEAPFVLDGLVGNAAEFDPLVHHVDSPAAPSPPPPFGPASLLFFGSQNPSC